MTQPLTHEQTRNDVGPVHGNRSCFVPSALCGCAAGLGRVQATRAQAQELTRVGAARLGVLVLPGSRARRGRGRAPWIPAAAFPSRVILSMSAFSCRSESFGPDVGGLVADGDEGVGDGFHEVGRAADIAAGLGGWRPTALRERCQGCFPPSPAPPGSGCPQLHRTAATARQGGSLTRPRRLGASWRTRTTWNGSATRVASSSRPASPAR